MISIIVPAFNESVAISDTVKGLLNIIHSHEYSGGEVLVVDDGSSDQTGDKAENAGARVLRHPHNVGYGRALKTGILAAQHDTIVIIDADLTYPADSIPDLLRVFEEEHYDMVVGERTGSYYRGGMAKWLLRLVLRALVEFSAGRSIPDINSGLRVFSKASVLHYLNHLCNTFSFTTSLTLAYMMTGRFVGYVPIEFFERRGSAKVRLVRDSLRTLQYVVQAINYYNPLKIFLLISIASFIASISGFVLALATNLTAPYFLGIGGLLLSLLVFCLGLLADLLRQIMSK